MFSSHRQVADFMRGVVGGAVILSLTGSVTVALEVGKHERGNLKACERQLCEIVLGKEPTAKTLTCDLQKTWAKKSLKNGAESKSINWSLGDARCKVDLALAQQPLVDALTLPKYKLKLPEHAVNCVVERGGEITPVNLSLKPKLKFKRGKAVEASMGIGNIEAPALIKSAIWTVAKMESNFGLFQGDILRAVNKFVGKKCAKRYPELKP